MRVLLLALLVVGLAAVAVPTASAHEEWCYYFDLDCRVECHLSHVKYALSPSHSCRTYVDP